MPDLRILDLIGRSRGGEGKVDKGLSLGFKLTHFSSTLLKEDGMWIAKHMHTTSEFVKLSGRISGRKVPVVSTTSNCRGIPSIITFAV